MINTLVAVGAWSVSLVEKIGRAVLFLLEIFRGLPGLLSRPRLLSKELYSVCLLYTSPSPRDATLARMPSSA